MELKGWRNTAYKAIQTDARFIRLCTLINLNEKERDTYAYLMELDGPVSLKSLSRMTGYSRRIVTQYVGDFTHMGLTTHSTELGVAVTDTGAEFYLRLFKDIHEISLAARSGFSRPVLSDIHARTNDKVVRPYKYTPQLRTVAFSKL